MRTRKSIPRRRIQTARHADISRDWRTKKLHFTFDFDLLVYNNSTSPGNTRIRSTIDVTVAKRSNTSNIPILLCIRTWKSYQHLRYTHRITLVKEYNQNGQKRPMNPAKGFFFSSKLREIARKNVYAILGRMFNAKEQWETCGVFSNCTRLQSIVLPKNLLPVTCDGIRRDREGDAAAFDKSIFWTWSREPLNERKTNREGKKKHSHTSQHGNWI